MVTEDKNSKNIGILDVWTGTLKMSITVLSDSMSLKHCDYRHACYIELMLWKCAESSDGWIDRQAAGDSPDSSANDVNRHQCACLVCCLHCVYCHKTQIDIEMMHFRFYLLLLGPWEFAFRASPYDKSLLLITFQNPYCKDNDILDMWPDGKSNFARVGSVKNQRSYVIRRTNTEKLWGIICWVKNLRLTSCR